MSSWRGVILDLDGTVYLGARLIPGADGVIASLRHQGYSVVFVTNALQSRREHAAKLNRLNIPADPDDVIHAPLVLTRYLHRHMPGASVFAIGEPPLLEELSAAQFRLSEDPAEIDVVVASFDPAFDYRKLTIAFQALRRGARFLATNADATCPVEGGEIPDAAAVIGALEGCSRRKLEQVVGKPSLLVAEAALERLGLAPADCLVVGDSLDVDIAMGHRAGLATALVLTGVSRRADLDGASVQPHYVLESIADLPRLLVDD
jgi:NagD protein